MYRPCIETNMLTYKNIDLQINLTADKLKISLYVTCNSNGHKFLQCCCIGGFLFTRNTIIISSECEVIFSAALKKYRCAFYLTARTGPLSSIGPRRVYRPP